MHTAVKILIYAAIFVVAFVLGRLAVRFLGVKLLGGTMFGGRFL